MCCEASGRIENGHLFKQRPLMDIRANKLKRRQKYYRLISAEFSQWADNGYKHYEKPAATPMPDDLRDMRCEAATRAGTPCKRKDIYLNGRCKYHGGLSSGAKTAEGKARQLEGYRRWQAEQQRAK